MKQDLNTVELSGRVPMNTQELLTKKQTVILGYIMYLSEKYNTNDGYFYASNKQLIEALGVSIHTLIDSIKKFETTGIITKKVGTRKNNQATEYKINLDVIQGGAVSSKGGAVLENAGGAVSSKGSAVLAIEGSAVSSKGSAVLPFEGSAVLDNEGGAVPQNCTPNNILYNNINNITSNNIYNPNSFKESLDINIKENIIKI